MPAQSSSSSSRNVSSSSYSDVPGETHDGAGCFCSHLKKVVQTADSCCGRRLHVRGHVRRRGRFPVGESHLMRRTRCPAAKACGHLLRVWMFVPGESSGGPQQNDGLSGDAPGVSGPQRGDGPPAYHAERAGHGSGSGQYPRKQRRHSNDIQPGRTRLNKKDWRMTSQSTINASLSPAQADPANNVAPMPAGTPVSNDLFSQALQQALQASNMSALQVRWRSLPLN